MENISIRNVKEKDWAKVLHLLETLVHENPPVALELEALLLRTEEWIRNFPQETQGIFVVAEQTIEQNIIGFCYLAQPNFKYGEAFIGIAVGKAFRDNNIASQMFYRVAEWASGTGINYIFADIWEWNNSSIKFFESLDFKEIERFDDKFRGEIKTKVRLIKAI